MTISYEWVYEECDKWEDIVDPLFSATLLDALDNERTDLSNTVKIALVQNIGNDEDGLINREYAYLDSEGRLPEEFDSGYRVPLRFHREVEKTI